MKQVVLLQRVLPHYRVPFVRELRARLAASNIELILVYGQQKKGTVPRTVRIDDPWAHRITNHYASVAGVALVAQSVGPLLRHADLIIVEHANQLLINYWLIVSRHLTSRKIAFFGHGRNFQVLRPNGLKNWLKSRTLKHVDWWFTYAEGGKKEVACAGFPASRITVINNTIDTTLLANSLGRVNAGELTALRSRLSLRGSNVGIFCGGMYPAKRLDFLLDAGHRIRALVPDFELLLVGEGPSEKLVVAAAAKYEWMHYVGAKTGDELSAIYQLGKVLLIPGVVGLVIIDSFVAELPLFTTDSRGHGPEIEYLQNGINGVMVEPDLDTYSQVIADHLVSDTARRRLIDGCKVSARTLCLASMVERFAGGIEQCLTMPDTNISRPFFNI